MTSKKTELVAIVGKNNVFDNQGTLNSYSRDHSYARMMKPQLVVKPSNAKEVQEIVVWANRTNTPLIPISSGPPHFHGDTIPELPGTVVLDLSNMKKIININRRNRIAIIEPGVTYSELQAALSSEGMRLSTSLLPRANKSVITSVLEREPRLNCRYQWSSLDPLRCVEIIWGDGNRLWSGDSGSNVMNLEQQWNLERRQVDPAGPAQTDFYRFLSAAQGSMGVATWASLKCEVCPRLHKLFFVPAEQLNDLIDFTYKLLRFRYADELFLMNGTNLAYLLGKNSQQIEVLKDSLPPWIVITGIAGRDELPEERVAFQENDIREIACQFNLELLPSVSGVDGEQVLDIIVNPSREPYWKLAYQGDCEDIFFITTLDRTNEFVMNMYSLAAESGYPVSNIGVYLQPRHQGANCHCEFNLPYISNEPEEASTAYQLYIRASESLMNQGAFFTRPYGIWADLAFNKDKQSTILLKGIKDIFDPRGVMNPGKLCFKTK